jgi:hypothetical protein
VPRTPHPGCIRSAISQGHCLTLGYDGAVVNGGKVFMWEVVDRVGNHNQTVVYEPLTGLIYYTRHPERVLSAEDTPQREQGAHVGARQPRWQRLPEGLYFRIFIPQLVCSS